MTKITAIKLFDQKQVRVHWDDEREKWYFSIVDVVAVLSESTNPQTYWRVLKKRLTDEGNETVTNCNGLKMPAPDGKIRLTDVADTKQLLRITGNFSQSKEIARKGGDAAKQARNSIEKQTGESIVSSRKYLQHNEQKKLRDKE